ncbi:MAG: CbbQ/NirQ/NorQ C-terminal domain-containing protein [Armatimonadota bacterium]
MDLDGPDARLLDRERDFLRSVQLRIHAADLAAGGVADAHACGVALAAGLADDGELLRALGDNEVQRGRGRDAHLEVRLGLDASDVVRGFDLAAPNLALPGHDLRP